MRENRDNKAPKDDIKDKLVAINRVTKVVKGGRRFGFAALVVAGDESGRVGFGHGKAKEVPEAIKKANDSARKSMVKIPLREGRTLHHDIVGNHGASKVVMRSAPSGTGIIAGGSVRAVFELLGIKDIVTKSIGSANPYNIIRAAVNGLKSQKSPKMVAARRSKKVAEINSSTRLFFESSVVLACAITKFPSSIAERYLILFVAFPFETFLYGVSRKPYSLTLA